MEHAAVGHVVAADIMQRDMVTVGPADTLREALELMTANHVTGLPVMDGKSRCIGLITASDILGFEEEHAEESSDDGMLQHFNPELHKWESVPISAFRPGGIRRRARRRCDDTRSDSCRLATRRSKRSRRRCSTPTFIACW